MDRIPTTGVDSLHRVDDAKQVYHDGITILRNSEVKNDQYIILVEGELQWLESMPSHHGLRQRQRPSCDRYC